MFKWITRVFRKKAVHELSPRERGIFSYWDGSRQRFADPIEICRAFEDHPSFDPYSDPKYADKQDAIGREAYRKMLQGIRDVLGVQSLGQHNGTPVGLTEQETMNLWETYLQFMEELKKNTSRYQTGSQHTASSPEENSTTKRTSDSGSTASDQSSSEPNPSSEPSKHTSAV